MKYSQFNSILPMKNKFVLFNSFNSKTIVLVPELKDLLNAAVNEGVDNLEKYHPSFYGYLCEQGFLIENGTDEIEQVKEKVKMHDENESTFILTVNPTMNCNFKCWYCYETHVKDSKLTKDVVFKTNKLIDKITDDPKINSFTLSFFGGEPLLYFEKAMKPILDHYIDACEKKSISKDIGITTNGFLINRDFVNFFKSRNIKCFLQITLDGGKDEHDKVRFVNSTKGSFDKIIENVKILLAEGFFINLRINYTDKNLESTKEIFQEFVNLSYEIKRNNLFVDFHRVWQNEHGENIDSLLDEIVGLFRSNDFHVLNKYDRDTVQSSCYADKRNSATINYNGDLYKCTARDFTKDRREGYIDDNGELIWLNNSLEKRMSSKFQNKPCLSCRIMPLCNGGCSQLALENVGEDYCVHHGDEKEKDKIIEGKITNILNMLSGQNVETLIN